MHYPESSVYASGNCADLQGLGGYGDDGGLQTIDQIKNPTVEEPRNTDRQPAVKKEENVNEKINTGDDIDFNK